MYRRLWLCLVPFLLCLADLAVTLWHQPDEYWSGQYYLAVDGAPHAEFLLALHPLAFVAGMTLYVATYCLAILLLPRLCSRILSVGLVVGHAYGVGSWIASDQFDLGYWSILGVCIVSAVILVPCLDLSDSRTPKK